MKHEIDLSKYTTRTDLAIEVLSENIIKKHIENYKDIKIYNINIDEKESKLINKKKGNYITGTIGAIIGACIAVIPLILRYMYARNNFAITIVSALATSLIAGISYLVYRLFFGKVGKKLPKILTIVSLLVITIVTTIICPIILLVQYEYAITFENWINLYSD